MKKEYFRSIRISQVLKKEISYIFSKEINDPRILNFMLTILDVNVSKDLSYAIIYVGFAIENNKKICNTYINILQKCSNYIKSLLSKKTQLRILPKLHFKYDNSFIQGNYISSIIKKSKN